MLHPGPGPWPADGATDRVAGALRARAIGHVSGAARCDVLGPAIGLTGIAWAIGEPVEPAILVEPSSSWCTAFGIGRGGRRIGAVAAPRSALLRPLAAGRRGV